MKLNKLYYLLVFVRFSNTRKNSEMLNPNSLIFFISWYGQQQKTLESKINMVNISEFCICKTAKDFTSILNIKIDQSSKIKLNYFLDFFFLPNILLCKHITSDQKFSMDGIKCMKDFVTQNKNSRIIKTAKYLFFLIYHPLGENWSILRIKLPNSQEENK